ncbi:6-bladed beta-propeller [Jejuia pallidilutea]|uniref:6-bladed beta-propeller n=1 Tax=Jejuia pallidilutea TaxID=504487 RepID=UPI0005A5FCD8
MFTFFITVFYLHSCKKKTFTKQIAKKVITINPNDAKQEVYLSELVDSISYIKLETNPDCIMGKVREIIIKGKYIYAVDQFSNAGFGF